MFCFSRIALAATFLASTLCFASAVEANPGLRALAKERANPKKPPCAGIKCPELSCQPHEIKMTMSEDDCCPVCVPSCPYHHHRYFVGETYTSDDGCKECQCTESGELECKHFCPEPSCTYKEQVYEVGKIFPLGDGCNSCVCRQNNLVVCTDLSCKEPEPTCKYGDTVYISGDSFPSTDGCNTCSCSDNGHVFCTFKACVLACEYNGEKYSVGETFPSTDLCNECTCTDNRNVACSEKVCI